MKNYLPVYVSKILLTDTYSKKNNSHFNSDTWTEVAKQI